MNKKEKFVINGLGGKRTLKGRVEINGAKNAALKAMAGAVLLQGKVELNNIPNTEDVHTLNEILQDLGAKIEWKDNNPLTKTLYIDTSTIGKTDINPDKARSMRASVVLTGPMLARFGKVSFPAPGGCVIGARPIDLFIDGYKKMGAKVRLENEIYYIEADRLTGTEITFAKITVGGTETLMMASVLGSGKTILKNCAKEPEIENVGHWLNQNGADIQGLGTDTIIINGNGGKLLNTSVAYRAIPDRIEAGSFLFLGALLAEELYIDDCRPDHLDLVIDLLKKSGVDIEIIGKDGEEGSIKISNKNNNAFRPFNVVTKEYPGFATDLQSPLVTYLTQCEGESTVVETIFEGRFKYAHDLVQMGARINIIDGNKALINGPTPLSHFEHVELTAHDIRAGFAIVLACLVAKGKFTISNIHLIDRGYESLETRLRAIGANVVRVS